MFAATLTAAPGTPARGEAPPLDSAPTSASRSVSREGLEPGQFNTDITRVAGEDRFATAAQSALQNFPIGVDRVYVATGRNFPDALAAGPVAGRQGAPILLTESATLPDDTRRALTTLAPASVIVLGGAQAVTDEVVAQIDGASGVTSSRLAGEDRFATAAAVAVAGFPDGADRVYVATGTNFPDALSGGAAGAATDTPIVLVTRDALPDASAAELARIAPDEVVVLGGEVAVSAQVLDAIEDLLGVTPTRLAGDDRFATAALISRDAFPDGAAAIFVATGLGFPDALSGAPAAALVPGPVLLTGTECIPDVVADEVLRLAAPTTTILGGKTAIGTRAAQLLPCSVDDVIPDVAVTVDTSVTPTRPTMTEFATGDELPLVAIADDEDVVVDLVAGQVVLVGTEVEAAEVGAALGTEVDSSTPLPDTGRSVHLFRVDPGSLPAAEGADPEALEALIRTLDPAAQGGLRVGDVDTLNLLRAVAALAVQGYAIGMNPMMTGDSIATRDILEAPGTVAGSGGISGYTRNPFDWDWANGTDRPETGVTEAWRAIAMTGREIPDNFSSRIPIGIIDGGFFDHPDLPRFRRNINNRNNSGECGGNPCPFHGTHVSLAATGLIGNERGAAGVAGQVASPYVYGYGGDVLSAIISLVHYIAESPDILNMSFSAPVPKIAAWLLNPLKVVTAVVGATGTMMFASAGNDGRNVDNTTCFARICWETHLVAPCELPLVQCVGGLDTGSRARHRDSAYGNEDVDLWAPYTVYVGQDPDSTANAARQISGTSFSSPFVAGAAALIRAADPGLSGGHVIDLLHDTSERGFGDVTDIVHVDDAVVAALGGRRPFDVAVMSPAPGTTIQRDRNLGLRVAVDDPDGTPSIKWEVDGAVVATSAEINFEIRAGGLSLGAHDATISISAGPYRFTETRRFTVVNTPALGAIRAPTDDDGVPQFFESSSILLDATAFDPDVVGRIPATANVRWRLLGGDVLRTGVSPAALVPKDDIGDTGRFTLELLIFEPEAGRLTVVDTVQFDVVTDPPDVPPNVDITDPAASGGQFTGEEEDGRRFRDVIFTVAANDPDPENDAILFDWSATYDSGDLPPGPLTIEPTGTTATTATFRLYMGGCGTTWAVSVVGTEDDGKDPAITGQDTQTFKVDQVC